ncbi:energy transducer TonB [candidate division KSB1 bacterium]|nr:energy transducer TonB [candidate division KSB1 bacterium]
MRKHPEADLRLKYRKFMEISLTISLSIVIIVFLISKEFRAKEIKQEVTQIIVEVEDIPQTEQIKRPPPPPRPAVPIESEDPDIEEDITIEETLLDLSDYDISPPPPPASAIEFFAYDEAPTIIGGMAAIKKNLVYPEIAQKAGVSATVIVLVGIDEKGGIILVEVMQERPKGLGFGEAAMDAVRKVKFTPGKQRDKPVPVKISIPVHFQIKK